MKITGAILKRLLKLDVEHALYRKDGDWYHNLKKFPGVLFDENGYVIFKKEKEYINNPLLRIRQDLNVSLGIENLPNYRCFSKTERLLIYGLDKSNLQKDSIGEEETIRVLRELHVILRKRKLVEKLKNLYDNTCQICGISIAAGGNKFYSEVHHIIPLGNPHNGSDTIDNMMCVCPNHHVQLDLKAIKIDYHSLKKVNHKISQVSIDYHNSAFKEFPIF